MKDLGLSYEAALHGVQSAVRFEMSKQGFPDDDGKRGTTVNDLKHHRVGIDSRASDMHGLVELLIAKGVFTGEEYVEHIRLAMNAELHRYEEHIRSDVRPAGRSRFPMKFKRDIERDKLLLRAHLSGGRPAVLAAAMHMDDFKKGPDAVDAYGRWISSHQRRSYRRTVAKAIGMDVA